MPLWVHGENFNMEYTELYFNPPLPDEWIDTYEVWGSAPFDVHPCSVWYL